MAFTSEPGDCQGDGVAFVSHPPRLNGGSEGFCDVSIEPQGGI